MGDTFAHDPLLFSQCKGQRYGTKRSFRARVVRARSGQGRGAEDCKGAAALPGDLQEGHGFVFRFVLFTRFPVFPLQKTPYPLPFDGRHRGFEIRLRLKWKHGHNRP